MNKYIIGDIHGHYDKLLNCLKEVNFNYQKDQLIQLGDIVDRGPNSYECIEELKKIKNLILIKGNHDECWVKSLENGSVSSGLLWRQGAQETFTSYCNQDIDPMIHYDFFKSQINYYIDEQNRYYVHGGFNRHYLITEQLDETVFTWDRDFWMSALSYKQMSDTNSKFKIKGNPLEVFIGHTPTIMWGIDKPMKAANVWNIDTGSGKGGLLTIMNIETKEYYQN